METIDVNYTAVVVAALLNMVLGSLWYGPLFGKKWKALMGFTNESMRSMKLSLMQAMAMGVVSSLVMAYVLAYLATIWGPVGVAGAFGLAFCVWVGFVATTLFGSVLWEGKSTSLFLLNAAYYLVALFVMALIFVFWV